VDDCLVIGKDEEIHRVIEGLREMGFSLKVKSDLRDYLSCCIIEDQPSKTILILQPHLIKNLESKFGDEVCNKRVYKTQETLRFKTVRPNDGFDLP